MMAFSTFNEASFLVGLGASGMPLLPVVIASGVVPCCRAIAIAVLNISTLLMISANRARRV